MAVLTRGVMNYGVAARQAGGGVSLAAAPGRLAVAGQSSAVRSESAAARPPATRPEEHTHPISSPKMDQDSTPT